MSDNSEFIGEFITESQEHLQQAEESLLHLAMDAGNQEAVQSCFRSLHTIKGGASFLGLERIQALAHAAEQSLDNIRTGAVVCGPEQADALLQALTRLGQLIVGLVTGATVEGDEEIWIERLHRPAAGSMVEAEDYAPVSEAADTCHPVQATSRRVARTSRAVATEVVSEAVLEGLFSSLLALERSDIPGLIVVLAGFATHGRACTWQASAMRVVERMQGVCDQLVLERAPADAFDSILSAASELRDLTAVAVEISVVGTVDVDLASQSAGAASEASLAPEASQQSDDFCMEASDLLAGVEAVVLADEAVGGTRIEDVFRAFHTIKGMAAYLGFARVEQLAHRLESELLPVRDGEVEFTSVTRSLVLSGVDALRTLIEQIRARHYDGGAWPKVAAEMAISLGLNIEQVIDETGNPITVPMIAKALIDSGLSAEVVAAAAVGLKSGEDLTNRLVKAGSLSKAQAVEVIAKQQELSAKGGPENFTRVSIARLEELVNMVGELLIAQAAVSQDPEVVASPRLQATVNRQGRIVRDLQTLSLGLRMVPLKSTFQKLARAVYDTARKVDKQIEFRVLGEDTEIDRTLAETLGDPLLHMVRNAVDHGIETAAGRQQAGKDAKGIVTLSASQTSDYVEIRLIDDGRGLDPKKLRAKAIEKGLIPAEKVLSEQECWQLIFLPGFSTAEQVTGISGRGVGMDVVKRNIDKMKGAVLISSKVGEGSTFTIRLPITTAILDAMLLRVGLQRFLVPVTAIIEAVRPAPGQVYSVLGGDRVIESRNQLLPVASLGERFAIPDAETDASAAVIMVLEHPAGRFALQVDEILGLQQVVIKPLDPNLHHHKGVAGTAILGDGRVGLILDPAELLS